jgi:hypothetical protein
MNIELVKAQVERQDFVDNACQDLLNDLAGKQLDWDIEQIQVVREACQEVIVDHLKLMSEMEFYPYIELKPDYKAEIIALEFMLQNKDFYHIGLVTARALQQGIDAMRNLSS